MLQSHSAPIITQKLVFCANHRTGIEEAITSCAKNIFSVGCLSVVVGLDSYYVSVTTRSSTLSSSSTAVKWREVEQEVTTTTLCLNYLTDWIARSAFSLWEIPSSLWDVGTASASCVLTPSWGMYSLLFGFLIWFNMRLCVFNFVSFRTTAKYIGFSSPQARCPIDRTVASKDKVLYQVTFFL